MGGSSLAPCVFHRTFGSAKGYPDLIVLDSTHPSAVLNVRKSIEPGNTLFIVSSKSGTTLETMSLYKYFWKEMGAVGKERGHRFIAITDPGTPLAELARKREFRTVIEGDPDVGGRYSALTSFGLVPAALTGVDVMGLFRSAFGQEDAPELLTTTASSYGVELGAILGELTTVGRDKATILASPFDPQFFFLDRTIGR